MPNLFLEQRCVDDIELNKRVRAKLVVETADRRKYSFLSILANRMVKQGRKPELTIFTSKKRTFPQAFSVRKSVVQAVEKFLQKEKLYVKRDTNVPFSARPEKKALRTAKVHSYPRSILKAQFSMS